MSDSTVRAGRVATAVSTFLDHLETSGRVWPPRDGRVILGTCPPQEVLDQFTRIEIELNPGRRKFADRKRVGDVLAWAASVDDRTRLPNWETDPTRLPVAGLAVATDTIIRWWELEKIADRPVGTWWPVTPTGTKAATKGLRVAKPDGWPP